MGKWVVWFVCGVVLLGACEQPRKKKEQRIMVVPALIHPLFFQEEVATQLNFPFWFNDSILASHRIRTIEWTVYRGMDTDESGKEEATPKMTTIYTFDEAGSLVSVRREHFSEGLTISSKQYALLPGKGLYRHVKHLQPLQVEDEEPIGAFSFLSPAHLRKTVWQYDNDYRDVRYHFFPEKKFQGPLSIDSIGHPGENDWVVLGTPDRPEKRYQVTNTVTERNITHYSYLNENYPATTEWNDYPFTQKRHFTYSPAGVFMGYIDSTFIDKQFVTRTVHSIRTGSNGLPEAVIHRKGHAASQTRFESTETLRYTFFTTE